MKFNKKTEHKSSQVNAILKLADEWVEHNTNYKFCVDNETFYEYKNGYYSPMHDKSFERMLYESEEFLYLTSAKIKELMHRISVLTLMEYDKFNAEEILNFKNGIYDIKKDKFYAHSSKYLSTIRIPYLYDHDATCPLWISFLNECLQNNQEYIGLLQEFMGYCLGRDNSLHKALILTGDGRNGKGTTFRMIEKMVGSENCSSVDIDKLSDQTNVINIFGKLINIDGDVNTDARGFESAFRKITGGDSIMAKMLYKNVFSFKPFSKLIIGANELPHIADKTHGFYDRLLVIPYEVSFAGREDRTLEPRLEKEVSGVLNWALEGRRRLYQRGDFKMNKQSFDIVDDIKRENNPVFFFIDDCCEIKMQDKDMLYTLKSDMYVHYRIYCRNSGYKALSKHRFGREFYRIMKQYTDNDARLGGANRAHIWENIVIIGDFYSKYSKNELEMDWNV